jgi:hypothetical protein
LEVCNWRGKPVLPTLFVSFSVDTTVYHIRRNYAIDVYIMPYVP